MKRTALLFLVIIYFPSCVRSLSNIPDTKIISISSKCTFDYDKKICDPRIREMGLIDLKVNFEKFNYSSSKRTLSLNLTVFDKLTNEPLNGASLSVAHYKGDIIHIEKTIGVTDEEGKLAESVKVDNKDILTVSFPGYLSISYNLNEIAL